MQAVFPIAAWRLALAALVTAISMAGCSSSESQNAIYIARAMNLVTDSPTQTVTIGDLSFQVAFTSGQGYSSAFAGSGEFSVTGFVPGADPGDAFESTLILKPAETTEFLDATSYTVINYGTVADFRTVTVANPVLEAVDSESNIVQVVHAALGAGNVDVYLTTPGADLMLATPTTLSAGQTGTPETITFADHQIRITAADTTDVIFDSGTLTPLLPGRLMYVIGKTVGPGLAPVFLNQWYNQGGSAAIADIDTPAFVRLMNLSPDAGPLDLFAEDDYAMPLATDTNYRTQSAYGSTLDTLPDGPAVFENTALAFSGTATDAEDGDLTAALSWASSIDGPLGSGGTVNATLSAGDHAVTASVVDLDGLTGTEAITVRVLPGTDAAPAVSITQPQSRTVEVSGTALDFAATADDVTDGDLSAALTWTSSIDGLLPDMGASITATLSPGVHAITASVSDSNGIVGSDTITVNITSGTNLAPVVTITTPDASAIEFDLTLAGDPASLLLQTTQQAANGTAYTFVVTGLAADVTAALVTDAVQNIATHNLLRVVHANSLLGSFDVYLTAPGTGITDASSTFVGITAGGVSGFTAIPGRSYDVTITDTGTSNVLLVIPALALNNGAIDSLAIVDNGGLPDFQLFTD